MWELGKRKNSFEIPGVLPIWVLQNCGEQMGHLWGNSLKRSQPGNHMWSLGTRWTPHLPHVD